MSSYRILVGDVREKLAGLEDGSVHCVVTSPPYWGLRDYGTAEWEGGDPECDHVERRKEPAADSSSTLGYPAGGGKRRIGDANTYHEAYTEQYRDTCAKCGAVRIDKQLGLEPTPEQYVETLVEVFREVRRVLRDDGTLWLNLGDSYAGSCGAQSRGGPPSDKSTLRGNGHVGGGPKVNSLSEVQVRAAPKQASRTGSIPSGSHLKPKDLVGIPWRVALALQADGWWLRSDIVWSKPNPMPESVTDRPTKAHEYVFLLTKAARYFYDADAVREPGSETSHGGGREHRGRYSVQSGRMDSGQVAGNARPARETGGRNMRSVWTITTKPFPEAHFAVYPPELPERCIKAGTSQHGACAECGAPWERVVEGVAPDGRKVRQVGRTFVDDDGRPAVGDNMIQPGVRGSFTPTAGENGRKTIKRETVGWQLTCDHEAPRVSCVVLDPFAGAGTTGVVCSELGRDFVGIELNEEYAAMAERRILDAPMSLFAAGAA